MWNPSVNAIWLRAGASSAASGMLTFTRSAVVSAAACAAARSSPSITRCSAHSESGRGPGVEHLHAPARDAAEVVEVNAEVGEEGRAARRA